MGTNGWMMALFVFLLFKANGASIGNMCELETAGSFQYFLVVLVLVVSSSLVLILLTGTTLEWCYKNNKDQHDLHLLFFFLLPILVSSLPSSRVRVCYHMKSKQKRKEICQLQLAINNNNKRRKQTKSNTTTNHQERVVVVAVFSQGKRCVCSHLALSFSLISLCTNASCVLRCILDGFAFGMQTICFFSDREEKRKKERERRRRTR